MSTLIFRKSLAPRRARGEDDPDQEGWVVAYADLITLLFIFFSLLLSISAVSRAKFEMLTSQFNQASTTSLLKLKEELNAQIKNHHLEDQVSTQLGDDGLRIQFNEKVLFATAEAFLNDGGKQVISQFSGLLKGMDAGFSLAIEGHTDDRPIHTAQFPSNWSLSSTRAVNVLHFLQEMGIPESKMTVRAYADTHPVETETEAAPAGSDPRAQNRRVTLLVY